MTLLHFPLSPCFCATYLHYKVRQKGVSAKANPLNTNDLGRFHRQKLCRLFGGWDGVDSGNFGQCWPRLGSWIGTLMLIEVGYVTRILN